MRWTLLLLTLTSLFYEGKPDMVAKCFPDWEFQRGSDQCYKMPLEGWTKTFNQAREYCQGHGGDSLIIKDQKTLDWVKSAMQDIGNDVVYTNAKKIDDVWKWMEDGTNVDTDLLPIDSTTSNGDCGCLTKEGKLTGRECSDEHPFMCHRNVDDPPPCDYLGGWEQMFDHCYMRSIGKKTWNDALSDCQMANGSLITINNDTEQQFAKDMAQHEHGYVWMGMTEEGHEGIFKWVDGDESTYSYWQDYEPSTQYEGRGRGAVDGEDNDGQWKVLDGSDEEMKYLCEKEKGACVYGWESFGESCYYFNVEKTDSLVWENANNTCTEVGAHLVIIDNEEENDFVRNNINDIEELWMGLKSIPHDDFYWIDGNKMDFTHMLDSDKSAALESDEENCVMFHIIDETTGDTTWVPADCHLPRHYVCEIKQGEPVKLIHHPTDKYCPPGWSMKDEKCYFFSEEEKNSSDAREYCRQNEGDLISINSWAEQDFVHCSILNDIIIGYSDASSEGSWKWVDDTTGDVDNWDEGEPNGGASENCGVMYVINGKWDDWYCERQKFFGCELPASDTPFGPVSTTVATTTTTEDPYKNCQGSEWMENPNTGECYLLSLAEKEYNDAIEYCENLDPSSEISLLSIANAEENAFVRDWLFEQHLSQHAFTIGLLNDVPSILWSDGTPLSYLNWDDGEPDSKNHDCANFYSMNGKWSDFHCGSRQAFICEKKGLNYKPVEPPPTPPPTCPEGWVFFNFHCYRFYGTKVSWEVGKAWCESHFDSSLAAILDSAENEFLNGMAKSMDVDLWIGLHDNDAGEDWYWIDGTSFEGYNNWNFSQPDNFGGAEHCGQLRPSLDGHWNDLSCDALNGAVCKMTLDTCPMGWEYHDKKCYYAGNIPAPFEDARNKCKEFNTNAELVTINNDEENTYFADFVPGRSVSVWIGYTFDNETQQWYWKDGSQSKYTNWNEGEPNNLDTELCTELISPPDGSNDEGWNNRQCSESKKFGCQYFPRHHIGCESGWTMFGDACYYIDPELRTYHEAKGSCAYFNAHLTSIHSKEENSFLMSLSESLESFWVGADDLDHPGTFTWVDGSPFTYSYWDWIYRGTYVKPACAKMKDTYSSTWEFALCDETYAYACKKPPEAVEINPKESGCHDDDMYYKGSCYTVHQQKLSWEDAKRTCEEKGTYLARMEDEYEGYFFIANLGDYGSDVWSDAKVHRNEDESVDFIFDDGQLVTYLPWDENQPDLNKGECIITTGTAGHSGYYRITQCDSQINFVCEYDREGYTTLPPTPTPTHGTFCYDGWDHFDGHCYKVISDFKTFKQGEEFCNTYGGHLASVNNGDEQNAITGYVARASFNASIFSVWVGLVINSYSDKHWTDGSPISYLSWDEDQPKMHDHENCASGNKDTMKLSCSVCESHLPFVCEAVEGSMISTAAPPTLPPTKKCDDGEGDWYLFQDHCYKFVSEAEANPETWSKSRELCHAEGAYLSSITGIDENYFIESMFSKMSDTSLWIGGRATENSGWEWVDGSPFTYENWLNGEPDHYLDQEDCIEMYNRRQGKWNDESCGHTNARVCKRPNGPTHPPVVPTLPIDGNCPDGWVHVATTGRCFKFIEGSEYFNDASAACRNLHTNAELVSIHTPKELAYITAGVGLLEGNAWVGMKFELSEYVWVDQSVVNYTPWAAGEPNGQFYEGECVEILYPCGLMNDIACVSMDNYICAMKQDPDITEPSTFPTCETPHENYFKYKGECYRAEKTGMNWKEAEQMCASEGSHLASIENINQNAFSWILAQDSETQNPWIGLNNKRDFRTYEWSDGWPAFYSNWGQDQPTLNTTDKNCVSINSDNGLWYNQNCDDVRPFLCRYSEDVAPTPDPPVTGHCPDDYNWLDFRGGYCYMVLQDTVSWDDATMQCTSMNANLTSIHSNSETELLKRSIRDLKSSVWIGLIQKKSGLGWSDGTPYIYENWHEDEPSSETDECTEFLAEDGTWNDLDCYSLRPFICKTPKIAEHEPTNPTVPPVHSTTHSPGGGGGSGLSGGAIFGIVVAVLVAFALVGFIGVTVIKKKKVNSSGYSRQYETPNIDIADLSSSADA